MPECLACEIIYIKEESSALKKETYCTAECELIFEASLKESAEDSKIRGLVDSEGQSILGNAYQQAIARTIREASAKIGIKLPSSENIEKKK